MVEKTLFSLSLCHLMVEKVENIGIIRNGGWKPFWRVFFQKIQEEHGCSFSFIQYIAFDIKTICFIWCYSLYTILYS